MTPSTLDSSAVVCVMQSVCQVGAVVSAATDTIYLGLVVAWSSPNNHLLTEASANSVIEVPKA